MPVPELPGLHPCEMDQPTPKISARVESTGVPNGLRSGTGDPIPVTPGDLYLYEAALSGTRVGRALIGVFDPKPWLRFQPPDPADLARWQADLRETGEQGAPVPLLAIHNLPDFDAEATAGTPALEIVSGPWSYRLWGLPSRLANELRAAVEAGELLVVGREALLDALCGVGAAGVLAAIVPLADNPPVVDDTLHPADWRGAIHWRPLHRVVRGLEHFQAGEMVREVRQNFFFEDVSRAMPKLAGGGPHFDAGVAGELLRPRRADEVTFLAITAQSSFRVHSYPGWEDSVLAGLSPRLRRCGCVQLDEIVLRMRLGAGAENVSYEPAMTEAVEAVAQGADVAFLLPPLSPATALELARAGERLPAPAAELVIRTEGLLSRHDVRQRREGKETTRE